MKLIKSVECKVFSHDGFTFRPVAVPSRGSSELAMWSLDVDPGSQSAPHSVDREEIFFVTAGELTAEQNGERFTATAGDALIMKPGAEFFIRNDSKEPARVTAVTSAGMRATVGGKQISPPWSL